MRQRYLARIRSFVTLANVAAALGIGIFLALALATQLASSPAEPSRTPFGERGARRLDFARGIARAAPTGEAIFVRTATGGALFDLDGQLLSRYQGALAGFAWLADGSGVLLREGGAAGGAELAPLAVLELDGRVTRLPADVTAAALSGARLSPDGRWIAVQTTGVLVLDREGAGARTLDAAALLGWDPLGRLVVRDGDAVGSVSLEGGRSAVALPAALRGVPLVPLDGREVIAVRGGGALWLLRDTTLERLPADCLPVSLRPGALLCAAPRAYALELPDGTRRELAATLDGAARAGARAATEDVLLWVDAAAAMHILDLSSGIDRVVEGVPGEAEIQTLPGGVFVANDSRDTYLIAARPR